MTRPSRQLRSLALLGLAWAVGPGCTGRVGESPGGTQPGATGGSESTAGNGGGGAGGSGGIAPPPGAVDWAGPAVFRRLTLVELQNAFRDLLGESMGAGFELAADAGTTVGFGTGAKFTNLVDALNFEKVTDQVTAGAVTRLATLVPMSCNLAATAPAEQDSCVKAFIEKFGLRTFRRPLLESEKAELLALYRTLRATDAGVTMADAIAGLMKGMLQSPQFLYHWELAEPAQKDGDLVRFGAYELASRLSFFLWASIPDEKLLAAAAAGQLGDPRQLEAQARRLLADARARDAISDFHVQWLEIAGLPGLTKDESYTKYNAAVGRAMIDETVAFAASVLHGPAATGKLQDLFTSTSTFMNGPLAALYGVKGVAGEQMVAAQVPAKERAGILTQGSFLASHADGDFSHPVRRGVTILRHVLCQEIPQPDNIMVPPLPERPQGVTTREFYSQHSKFAGLCAGCHDAIDPMGFAFENFDAVGQYRETEVGKPVDASGTLMLAGGPVAFQNAVEMTTKLAQTTELRDCITRHWVRYLLRRQELREEKGSIDVMMKAFERSGWDVREMLVAITATRAFTHRQPFQGEQTR
jgi:hypothetical protein